MPAKLRTHNPRLTPLHNRPSCWQPTERRLGAQDAGYEVGDCLIALEAKHPGKQWVVLSCGRASKFAPAEQAPGPISFEETSLIFKNNLPEVRSAVLFLHRQPEPAVCWVHSVLQRRCGLATPVRRSEPRVGHGPPAMSTFGLACKALRPTADSLCRGRCAV